MPVVVLRTDGGPGPGAARREGEEIRVEVEPGVTVLDAAREAGVPLAAPCGGRGRCGKCAVEVIGPPPPTDREREVLPAGAIERGVRLACRLRVTEDIEVLVPRSSRAALAEILEDGECVAFPLDPAVRAADVKLPEPSLEDPADDVARLAASLGLGALDFEMGAARALPAVLRENGFEARILLRDAPETGLGLARVAPPAPRLLRVLPPGAPLRALGAAFDIGTTSVAGSLLDLATGRALASASRTNPQASFGDDVVSRMDHASRGKAELEELRLAVTACLNGLLEELVSAARANAGANARANGGAGLAVEDVHDICVAGNTVMTHLFLGLPPGAIATVPFTPVSLAPGHVRARELGLAASPLARVWCAPSASAYVGGDITAGLAAAGFGALDRGTLYIDIGTNGEVVAGSGERAMCAATAAGPAFEGARIRCGMRASAGAISHAEADARGDGLALEVIGGGPPCGICGTGLVDLAAALVRAGVIDRTGRMAPGARSALGARVRESDAAGAGGTEFLVASGPEGEVVLTQRDVRELQLAKGAVAAGAEVLLARLGIAPSEVETVLLAGAFGSTIRPASAAGIGLLPPGCDPGRVRAVGNAAAAGARASVLSTAARDEAARLARWLEPVELSADPAFQERFAEAMMFPGGPGDG